MAAFYKFVIFKNKEHYDEIQKFRQALQTKRLQSNTIQREQDKEKGLLMAKFDLKSPMKITFMNKVGQKLTQYTS